MLQPKRTKYRKMQKGRIKGIAIRGIKLNFGAYGIVACEPGRITSNQIEATRVSLNRKIKQYGRLWIRIFPSIPITKKPAQVRMGQGKGTVDHWVARVKPNRVLFEISQSIPRPIALLALKSASHKLPVLTKIIEKESLGN